MISTKLMKLEDELVAPIKSTTLEGQGLIWIHEADEVDIWIKLEN